MPADRPWVMHSTPFLYNTLHIWDKQCTVLAPDISPLPSLLEQARFLPGSSPLHFDSWCPLCLSHFLDVLDKGSLLPKSGLDTLLGRPIPWFIYLPLQHLISSSQFKLQLLCPLSSLESLIKHSSGSSKGLILCLYAILMWLTSSKLLPYQNNWLVDLD